VDGEAKVSFRPARDASVFRVMVIASVAFHLVLLTVAVLSSMSKSGQVPDHAAIQTRLVRLGQDKPEWLPRMETPPAPPPAAAPAVVTAAKAAEPPKPATDEKKRFEDSLKRLDALERKEQDDYKGKGDPHGSKAGTVSDFTKQMLGLQWVGDVVARIRPNLVVPTAIPEGDRAALKVTVTLIVAGNGKVLRMSVQSSSGSALFDKAVLRAIEASAPLPAPPLELRQQLADEGVDIEILGGHGG
jgi:TonB family protein